MKNFDEFVQSVAVAKCQCKNIIPTLDWDLFLNLGFATNITRKQGQLSMDFAVIYMDTVKHNLKCMFEY